MSDIETIKGTLKPVRVMGRNNLDELCEYVCKIHNLTDLPDWDWCDTWEELLKEELYEKYRVINGLLYSIEQTKIDPDGFAELDVNEDGTIDFFVSWYNGGAYFSEVIEVELERMKNK